jgi:hypothetical protein
MTHASLERRQDDLDRFIEQNFASAQNAARLRAEPVDAFVVVAIRLQSLTPPCLSLGDERKAHCSCAAPDDDVNYVYATTHLSMNS